MSAATPPERVVLLDEHRRPVGTADKRTVHHAHTPLHLAFSCYVFDGRGNVLVTRRALAKRTWPGVWTNSFCGHPAPGEELADAVRRRAGHELGLDLVDVELVLPDFAYRATAPDGTVENEVCPVFRATAAGEPVPNPDEVVEWRWAPWSELAELGRVAPWAISPWAAEQLPLLAEVFGD
ncbi:isopentenyl-diphosphate delta-isomerase [Streptoalloteichus tenebrarius]|uniref:Isopentenyl-diphosphate Delta-isomerase n=1 Tax=Streptoalloteichus tenebrarius (strain ATCC 17920 / DSM 40477 / JCM 4838 / CBS 697.72 / NBRC 16177 / NCIMB 11028 / NRRL B-12390 / A12253. 1 / ISP 5477) TaxID=1933 RepID=A0ABT1HQG1_STRSD|nr:isopentenyl-diphosphate Delta-isomerase [Streptoalloteichus tenebrarius]MCP2257749.1 isopentenyl-diphosphate delta-isomerase [Streptoalloteichus tenebrarius]BFE99893.1 isopentenyl-diphosphate Delta-isomerase [Streptoalloteichus tenebrarius]